MTKTIHYIGNGKKILVIELNFKDIIPSLKIAAFLALSVHLFCHSVFIVFQ